MPIIVAGPQSFRRVFGSNVRMISQAELDGHEKPDWLPPETLVHLRDVGYRFPVRAFGEEMARVNFLPLEKRKQYLYEILDHARRQGVKSDKPARAATS